MRATLGSSSSAKTALGKPTPEPSPGSPDCQPLGSPGVGVDAHPGSHGQGGSFWVPKAQSL